MSTSVDFLVFGARGYFGSHLVKILEKQKRSFATSNCRIEYRDQVEKEIAQHNPKYVLNAAGLAGTPNIVRGPVRTSAQKKKKIARPLTVLVAPLGGSKKIRFAKFMAHQPYFTHKSTRLSKKYLCPFEHFNFIRTPLPVVAFSHAAELYF